MNSAILLHVLLAIKGGLVGGENDCDDFSVTIQQVDFIRGKNVRFNCSWDADASVVSWSAAPPTSVYGPTSEINRHRPGTDDHLPEFDNNPTEVAFGEGDRNSILTISKATEHYGYHYIRCVISTASCHSPGRKAATQQILIERQGALQLGSFHGEVRLNCDHKHENHQDVKWTYLDKYNDGTVHEVIGQNGSASNATYGENFTERIPSWNYDTGDVVIDNLGCWDDQVYYCNISAANDSTVFMPIVSHRLVLGIPSETPTVTITVEGVDVEIFAPGRHDTVRIDNDTLLLTSSVRSRPAVSFFVDSEKITPACEMPADACPGEVLCSLSAERKLEIQITNITVDIMLDNWITWSFHIQVDNPSLSTTARPETGTTARPETGTTTGQVGNSSSGQACSTVLIVLLLLLYFVACEET